MEFSILVECALHSSDGRFCATSYLRYPQYKKNN